MAGNKPHVDLQRRRFLRRGLVTSSLLAAGSGLWHFTVRSNPERPGTGRGPAGSLEEIAVENDPSTRMLVPRGFRVREVARSGRPAFPGSPYAWHPEPDGGAVFTAEDGGWIYVSNSEMEAPGTGGAGALRFNARGEITGSYPICSGTTNNCAGGPTPWGTWLSCEEIPYGLVYECDPAGDRPAAPVPALGAFTHEAVAVDPEHRHLYLTEDVPDGKLYRFIPAAWPAGGRADLSSGRLQAAVVEGQDPHGSRSVRWVDVPRPDPRKSAGPPVRHQVSGATGFNGGEGCWYHAGVVYFTTKGDNRVWALDTKAGLLDLIYDRQADRVLDPGMDEVDNVTVSGGGDVLVAEDGREMRLVVVRPGEPYELLNVIGHEDSEITGPAFSPDGTRLYFSSQRGPSGKSHDGRTYEMRGAFFGA